MRKRLWLIFGPVICAVALILITILLANPNPKSNYDVEKKAAVATTPQVFKSGVLKRQALSDSDHRFVPFFGSSEWKRMDSMHPSVLAEGYQRSYRPFLIGQAGATSLAQYFGMQQITDQLQDKQAVFVISPQWFVKDAQKQKALPMFYSKAQGLDFLQNQTGTDADRYVARRFVQVNPKDSLTGMMTKVADGKTLSKTDNAKIKSYLHISNKEDAFFSTWKTADTYDNKIAPKAKKLPQPYNERVLSQLATETAQKDTSNNPYHIKNSFYTKRIKSHEAKLAGSQKNFNYVQSREYNDFQAVLNQFAESNTDVMFVIPPVNKKWAEYTGLNEKMYQKSVEKMKFQLSSQGFNQVADLSKNGNKPYYMEDTVHLGWNGWLNFDQHVNRFLTTKQKAPNYKINNQFLDNQWAMYEPKAKDDFSKFK